MYAPYNPFKTSIFTHLLSKVFIYLFFSVSIFFSINGVASSIVIVYGSSVFGIDTKNVLYFKYGPNFPTAAVTHSPSYCPMILGRANNAKASSKVSDSIFCPGLSEANLGLLSAS